MCNEYDNEKFFNQYAQMPRSKEGLSAAGEWHQFKQMIPSLVGKRVLDLGCGYGWHCRYSEEKGAAEILGLDGSEKMLEEARKRNSGTHILYQNCTIEEYAYPQNRWDCVLSNLALHYIEDLEEVFCKVYRTLKKDGVFVFNIEHPVFTSGVNQEWILNEQGRPLYWPVDDYFLSGKRETNFLGCPVMKFHHTLTQILMGLLNAGFILERIEEAKPSEEMKDLPGMKDELRRPMMLLVRARKFEE